MIVTQVYKHAFVGGHNIVEAIFKIDKLVISPRLIVKLKKILVISYGTHELFKFWI